MINSLMILVERYPENIENLCFVSDDKEGDCVKDKVENKYYKIPVDELLSNLDDINVRLPHIKDIERMNDFIYRINTNGKFYENIQARIHDKLEDIYQQVNIEGVERYKRMTSSIFYHLNMFK